MDRLTRAARRGEITPVKITREIRLRHVPRHKAMLPPTRTVFVYEQPLGARRGYVRRPHHSEENIYP